MPSAAILVTAIIMSLSALFLLPIPSVSGAPDPLSRRAGVWRGLVDGLRYVAREPALRAVQLFLFVYVILAMPYRDILPAIAATVLEVGASGLGLLSSAVSIGALLGTVILSSVGEIRPRGRLYLAAGLLDGLGVLLFSRSHYFPLSLLLLAISGLGHGFFIPLSNTLLQAYAEPSMRARVIGMNMFVWSLQPFGTIAIGAAADRIGPAWALFISATIACGVFGFGLLSSPTTCKIE